MGQVPADTPRIASLDQFRGYTVAGMFLVNFVGHFQVIPAIFKHHHTYCSYADTIMPHFMFAVGFAYRMTLLRRLETASPLAAYARVVRRNLGLILLGLVLYHLGGRAESFEALRSMNWHDWLLAIKRSPFQTLTHIGATSLWVLPVIARSPAVRLMFAALSGGLHAWLSYGLRGWPLHLDWSAYEWVLAEPRGIDGGPLGFLTWTLPLLAGSLAYDVMALGPSARAVARLLGWGVVVMGLGYGLSCLNLAAAPNQVAWSRWNCWLLEPPFVSPTRPINMWTMSQRAGSVSYLVFGAGLSLAVYGLFVLLCDLALLRLGVFRTLGTNALAGYVIHDLVDDLVQPYAPNDSPLWYALASFAVFFGICWLFLRHMERNRLYLRL